MSGEELYGAAVRIIGLGLILYGLYTIIWGMVFAMWPHAWKNADGGKEDAIPGQYFFAGAIQVFIGVMLIAEAPQVVAWSY
jgi:hypothetical protein